MPVTMPESHCLDDPSVESYCIPGAKVFDRYFECPLGASDSGRINGELRDR